MNPWMLLMAILGVSSGLGILAAAWVEKGRDLRRMHRRRYCCAASVSTDVMASMTSEARDFNRALLELAKASYKASEALQRYRSAHGRNQGEKSTI